MTGPQWHFGVLGPLRIERDGEDLSLTGTMPRTLLALLLMAEQPQSLEVLTDRLWNGRPPAQANSAFHVHLSKLRRLLGPLLERSAGGYGLNPGQFSLDATRFLQLTATATGAEPAVAAATLAEALALWRGEALSDLPAYDVLEMWRRELTERRLEATVARVDADLTLGLSRELIGELTQLSGANPYDEKLAGQLMVALYRSGRQSDALAAFDRTRRTLLEDLGLEPGETLKRLQAEILVQDPGLTLDTPPAPAPAPGSGRAGRRPRSAPRLPRSLTPLIGRDQDLVELFSLTGLDHVRLVTLTGPGGVGKTRLSLEYAERRAPELADGALFVELAPLTAPAQVGAEIAATLARADPGSDPSEATLGEYLADRELLLVLDNFEHVVEAAPLIADLLQRAPDLRVLATSRSPLRLRGEHVQEVRPLGVSGPGGPAGGPAVDLFMADAQAARRELVASDENRALAADICRGLDGLPLAIELAAARASTLSLAVIRAGLVDPLSIGGSGLRDLPTRQNSLDTAIAWSEGLLTRRARETLHAASVFAGSFSAEALAAVLDRSPAAELPELVDASLLRVSDSGDQYEMLSLVRAFGRERLGADPAAELAIQTRHQAYFTARYRYLLEDRRPSDVGREARERSPEHADLRQALDFALERRDAEAALILLFALRPLWLAGEMAESDQILRHALEVCEFSPDDELHLIGVVAAALPSGASQEWVRRGIARAREVGETGILIAATVSLISGTLDRRDWTGALRERDGLLAIELTDRASANHLAARASALAVCAYLEGDDAAALSHCDEFVSYAAEANAHVAATARSVRLVIGSAVQGQIDRAELVSVVTMAREVGVPDGAVTALWLTARYAAAWDLDVTAAMLGAAERHANVYGVDIWPEDELRDEALAALGMPDRSDLARAAPQEDLDASLATALNWLATRPEGESTPRPRPALLIKPARS